MRAKAKFVLIIVRWAMGQLSCKAPHVLARVKREMYAVFSVRFAENNVVICTKRVYRSKNV